MSPSFKTTEAAQSSSLQESDFELPRLPSLEAQASDSEDIAHFKRILREDFGPANAWHRLTSAPYVDRNTYVVAVAGTLPGTSRPSYQGWHVTELLFWYHLYKYANIASKAFLTCVKLKEMIKEHKRLLWYKHVSEPRRIVLDEAIYEDQFAGIEVGNLPIRDGTLIDKAYLIGNFLDQVQIACRSADADGADGHVLVFIFSDGNSKGELRLGSNFVTAEHIRQRVQDSGTRSRVTVITSACLSAGYTYLNLDVSSKPLKISMVADEKVLWFAYACRQTPTVRCRARPDSSVTPVEIVDCLLAPDFDHEISEDEQLHLWLKCPSYRQLAYHIFDNHFAATPSRPDVYWEDLFHLHKQDKLCGITCSETTDWTHLDYVSALDAISTESTEPIRRTHDSIDDVTADTAPCGPFDTQTPIGLLVNRLRSQALRFLDSESKHLDPLFIDIALQPRRATSAHDGFYNYCKHQIDSGQSEAHWNYGMMSERLDRWMMRVKTAESYMRLLNINCSVDLKDIGPQDTNPVSWVINKYDLFRKDLATEPYWRIEGYMGRAIMSDERFQDEKTILMAIKRLKRVSYYTNGTLQQLLRVAFSNRESPEMQMLAQLRRERRENPFIVFTAEDRKRVSLPILITKMKNYA